MKLTPLTTLAALVLIGIGGFVAGRVSSPEPTASETERPAETRSSRSVSRTSAGDDEKTREISRTTKLAKSSSQDRLARLEAIIRSENPLDRTRALLTYLDQLGPGDFEAAIAHFRSLGLTESRNGEYGLLLTAWARQDPLSALAYAEGNTRGGFAQDTILTSWASIDPEAAIRWAQSNFDGDGANPFMPGIIRGLAQSDPARATELLAAMPRSEERGKGLDFMLPHLLKQGAAATQTWIAAITDETLRNGAMIRAAEQLAATDPAGTANWLLANPGDATRRRMDDVYSTWARKDQQAALTSYGALPTGEIRSNALRGLVRSFASDDPKAAVSLMDRYQNDVTDDVLRNFVWHSFGTDPTTAVSQIARIGDQGRRDEMYRRALDSWIEDDPTTAQAWIQANPIPESVQKHLARRQNPSQ